jgi:hypothetical protein
MHERTVCIDSDPTPNLSSATTCNPTTGDLQLNEVACSSLSRMHKWHSFRPTRQPVPAWKKGTSSNAIVGRVGGEHRL